MEGGKGGTDVECTVIGNDILTVRACAEGDEDERAEELAEELEEDVGARGEGGGGEVGGDESIFGGRREVDGEGGGGGVGGGGGGEGEGGGGFGGEEVGHGVAPRGGRRGEREMRGRKERGVLIVVWEAR